MKAPSRRQFCKACLYLALSGFGPVVIRAGIGRASREPPRRTPPAGEPPANAPPLEPAYLKLHRSGELKIRGEALWDLMGSCELCPRTCGVNRLEKEQGVCGADSRLEISAFNPHFGEERPLVGSGGSGTIFLTHCGLRCVFCINWEISQKLHGDRRSIRDMAAVMIELQRIGCHNINLVTPTHYSPHIVLALDQAAGMGLKLPVVYNTCGWERLQILKKLDGIVDIYLPDFKYWDGPAAAKYSSGARTYPEVTRAALLEMQRQVGTAKPAADGLVYRGLMIRHLVMPNDVCGTRNIVRWIAENLPPDTYLNIMSQYRPVYKAFDYPEISRKITRAEYRQAVEWAKRAGLTRLDIQGYRF